MLSIAISGGKVILDTKAKLFLPTSLFIVMYNVKTASPAKLGLIVSSQTKVWELSPKTPYESKNDLSSRSGLISLGEVQV
jgi:hypothetical protein